MTILPRFIPETDLPEQPIGKKEASEFLNNDSDFIRSIIKFAIQAEDNPAATPIPEEAIYFLRVLLHAAGETVDNSDLAVGLSLLDHTLVDKHLQIAPQYQNLYDELAQIKPLVIAELAKQTTGADVQFDSFVRNAVDLTGSGNFADFSQESLPDIRAQSISIRLSELTYLHRIISSRAPAIQDYAERPFADLLKRPQPANNDSVISAASKLADKIRGDWTSQNIRHSTANIIAGRGDEVYTDSYQAILPLSMAR